MTDILELFSKRHSFYDINANLPAKKEHITDIIKKCLELYPSSFNTQGARLMLLFDNKHREFWELVEKELLKNAPKDKTESIKKRIESFMNGYGTILFFDDKDIVQQLEKKMPLYAENFGNWANQSNAILQFMIWSALADNNIGASMQHYNPLIDNVVKKTFNVPENWEFIAQMPFGGIAQAPAPHIFENIESKLIIKS